MVDPAKLNGLLGEFARTLVTDASVPEVLHRVVTRVGGVLPVTCAGVALLTGRGALSHVAASDPRAARLQALQHAIGEGPLHTAFRSGAPVEATDLAADPRFPRFGPRAAAEGLTSVSAFALQHRGQSTGALELYRSEASPLSDRQRAAAQLLSDIAAVYIVNAAERAAATAAALRSDRRAMHDDLTGLPNRRLLQQRLEHAALRAGRARRTVALLFVDLDGFKRVNDSWGHRAGDRLLIAVAERLRRLARGGDTLARLAGDEFVFLCEDLNGPDNVLGLARRIDAIFARPFDLPELDLQVSVTASVGVAFATQTREIAELLDRADEAMYAVKRAGGAGHRVVDTSGWSAEPDTTPSRTIVEMSNATGTARPDETPG